MQRNADLRADADGDGGHVRGGIRDDSHDQGTDPAPQGDSRQHSASGPVRQAPLGHSGALGVQGRKQLDSEFVSLYVGW